MSIKIGKEAEDVAASYLSEQGLKVVARNIRYRFGEIDIIAFDKKTLVFVEVKHRYDNSLGEPYLAVNKGKQRKIILAAKAYLQKIPGPMPDCRFDVISMVGDLSNPKIEHFTDAFRVST